MPDAYLFDIGNVIITFDFSKAARKLAAHSGLAAEHALPLVAPLTVDLELGRLTPDEFIKAASELIGFTGDASFFRTAFEDIFELNLPMVAFIEERKAEGSPLYCFPTQMVFTPRFSRRLTPFLTSSTDGSIRTRSR